MRAKLINEGYGSGFSFTGGSIRGMGGGSRGGFGGASNLGGPNMMYTYEIKPLNHTLEPKPTATSEQIEQIKIGSKVIGSPIRSNNIHDNKKIEGIVREIKMTEDGATKYYLVFDPSEAKLVKLEPTSTKLIIEQPIKYFADAGTDSPSERKRKMERAAKNRKLVSESLIEYKKIKEGIGDKYAEKQFHITDKENEFSRNFNKQQENIKPIGSITTSIVSKKKLDPPINVYKNPKTLDNIAKATRGIVTKDGNLYVADSSRVIHGDIIHFLEEKNIIPEGSYKGWEDIELINFMSVQRVSNNKFVLGESYSEDKEKIQKFTPYIQAAKKVNPQYEFTLESAYNFYH